MKSLGDTEERYIEERTNTMRHYWYISLSGKYPRRSMSVQIAKRYTIVELTDEATVWEIDVCKLVFIGIGSYNDKHIQENIKRWLR